MPEIRDAEVQNDDSGQLWGEVWYPVAFAEFTDKGQPAAVELLGAPVVLWWEPSSSGGADGHWRCGLDRCPHRFVRLSEGRVDEAGCIQCPYHGWAFAGADGSCASIPQLEGGKCADSGRARLLVLPVRERQGLLWVWSAALVGSDAPPDEEKLEALLVPQLELPGVTVLDYSRDLPMDATVLCENVMDPSHLPFTHDGTISRRSAAGPVPLRLRGPVERGGFAADRATSPPGEVEFRAPHCVISETRREGSFRDWNVVYALPMAPGRARAFIRVVFEVGRMEGLQRLGFSALFGLPPWLLHQNNHRILEDDNIFLHHQDLALRASAAAAVEEPGRVQPPDWQRRLYLASSADTTVAAYRSWLERFTGGLGPSWSSMAPAATLAPVQRLDRRALLDRGATHTAHCSSCQRARQRAEALVPLAELATIAGLVAAAERLGGSAWYGGVLALMACALRILCLGLVDSTESGAYPPPRNRRQS